MFGGDPALQIIDPISDAPVAAGSLILLIHDSDQDGSTDDVDMSDGTPINQDIEIGRFQIGDGGFPPFIVGGGARSFILADLNNAIDVVPGVNGDTGHFYIRVFNMADPSQGGELRWGDSIDYNAVYISARVKRRVFGHAFFYLAPSFVDS